MGCAMKNKDEVVLKAIPDQFIQQEARILSKIYDDLAERTPDNTVTKEIFLLFFHKTGYWGDRLFTEFAGRTPSLSKQQFFSGIAHIFQTSEEQKIQLLYHFYVETKENRGKGKHGLTFKQFLDILFLYPKDELVKIMDDEQFLHHNIKDCLKQCPSKSRFLDPKGVNLRVTTESKSPRSRHEDADYQMSDSEPSVQRIPSAYGYKGIFQQIEERRKPQRMDVHMDGKKIRIKLSTFNTLIRKFARSIFQTYKLDIEKGRLKRQQFKQWIQQHKNLYNNYYDGFHGQIWKYTRGEQIMPAYLLTTPERQSKAQFLLKGIPHTCLIKLINSTILVLNADSHDNLFTVINLEGLCVKKYLDEKHGWGLKITHRDGHYKGRTIIFKDQKLCNEWETELKIYQGIDIRQLYSFGPKIAAGSFSVVYEVTDRKTGKKWAMKQIENSKLKQSQLEMIHHQIEVMKKFDNPLLIQYKQTVQTKQNTYIITELVQNGKELYEYVKQNRGPLKEVEAADIARQIILGVMHIHKHGYIHRDLKPENIMVFPENNSGRQAVKIIDFGLSLNTQTALRGDDNAMCAGTAGYISPEQFFSGQLNELADSFSIGGIIYFMLTGNTPFYKNQKDTTDIILNRNKNGELLFSDQVWGSYAASAKQIVQDLTKIYPDERLKLNDALTHSWFMETNPTKKCD